MVLDIFKKKKKTEKQEIGRTNKVNKKEIVKKEKKSQREAVQAYKFLKDTHITEKAGDLTEKNQYIFKVYSEANKINIKKAVEEIFKVNVISVNIINVPKKKRRLGKISGWRKGYKKAIVRIKDGQKIELLPR